jgi:hypothetical protein
MGGKSNPIEDVLKTTVKGISDVFGEVDRIASGDGIHLDPFVKQKQEAKDAVKKDAKNRAAALEKQKNAQRDEAMRRVQNEDANKGATVILGSKGKRTQGASVSSGMGLSKGKTGLQS